MKNRSLLFPVVLTVLCIASIGSLYARTATANRPESTTTDTTQIIANLNNVSGKELVNWLKVHNIYFVSRNMSPIQDQNFTIYVEKASPSEVVQAVAESLGVGWRQEGNIFVLSPAVSNSEPKGTPLSHSLSTPAAPKAANQGTATQPAEVKPTLAKKLVSNRTDDQDAEAKTQGYLSTKSLTKDQQQLIVNEVGSGPVDLVVVNDHHLIHIKGEL